MTNEQVFSLMKTHYQEDVFCMVSNLHGMLLGAVKRTFAWFYLKRRLNKD
jgi:uncharacterized protein (DUF362 family)